MPKDRTKFSSGRVSRKVAKAHGSVLLIMIDSCIKMFLVICSNGCVEHNACISMYDDCLVNACVSAAKDTTPMRRQRGVEGWKELRMPKGRTKSSSGRVSRKVVKAPLLEEYSESSTRQASRKVAKAQLEIADLDVLADKVCEKVLDKLDNHFMEDRMVDVP
ncbi:hypothetical protein CAPTEDRAFT_192698 [Capitella teleta]|uniref:Uncharacterized protein n=1 Tax=Capitella teleta TaxID=283909 RepID=R7ULX1_CAPTE|nr:hypothetical protein CAPTEDRAFT_192698 [Capitella teleta]|eukprot:ELU04937.1 hypothetical protein CAPTEDRAFT_192698 [Capitella teleta]